MSNNLRYVVYILYIVVVAALLFIANSYRIEMVGNIGATMLLTLPIIGYFILWLGNKNKTSWVGTALYSFTLVVIVAYVVIVFRFSQWTLG